MIEKFTVLINWFATHQLPVPEQFIFLHHFIGGALALVILIIGAVCVLIAISDADGGCVVLWGLPIALILAPTMYTVGAWTVPIIAIWVIGAWIYKIYHRRNWLPY